MTSNATKIIPTLPHGNILTNSARVDPGADSTSHSDLKLSSVFPCSRSMKALSVLMTNFRNRTLISTIP